MMELSDPMLRKGAAGKLQNALSILDSLHSDMSGWWESNSVSLQLESANDGRTLELVMRPSSVPPVDLWWNRASDAIQNFRDALNRLNNTVYTVYVGKKKPHGFDFPITSAQAAWDSWMRIGKAFPEKVSGRYRDFQPWVSGRDHLSTLHRTNNIEKHGAGLKAAVSLVSLEMDQGSMTVEGLWNEEHLADKIRLNISEAADIVSEHQVLALVEMPTRVLSLGDAPPKTKFHFEPMVQLERDRFPLWPAMSLISREVIWVIAYVCGLVDSSVDAPQHFDI